MTDNKNFEDYFNEYKDLSEKLKDEDLSLDEAMKYYRESKEIYEKLRKIIEESKLEIEKLR